MISIHKALHQILLGIKSWNFNLHSIDIQKHSKYNFVTLFAKNDALRCTQFYISFCFAHRNLFLRVPTLTLEFKYRYITIYRSLVAAICQYACSHTFFFCICFSIKAILEINLCRAHFCNNCNPRIFRSICVGNIYNMGL